MLRTLLLVALCGLVSGAAAASRFHERNHSGLLFLYTFDEGQVPTSPPSEVRDVSGRYLMGNLTASTTGAVSWSATRQGMTIPSIGGGVRATSVQSSAAVLPLLTNEFSLEFFLRSPDNPVISNLLIAGFGDWVPGAPFEPCNSNEASSDGGWRLFQRFGDLLTFAGVFSSNGVPTCFAGSISLAVDTVHHLVVRARPGVMALVSDDSFTTISADDPTFDPEIWGRNTAPLTLALPHVATGWTGSLYMVAMYDRYLSDDEIAANRVLGPPNSVPYGAGAVEVDEDVSVPLVVASA
jgi:hypothetical protein